MVQRCRADSKRRKRAQEKECGRGNVVTNACAFIAWKHRFEPNCRAFLEMRKNLQRKFSLAQCSEDLVTT